MRLSEMRFGRQFFLRIFPRAIRPDSPIKLPSRERDRKESDEGYFNERMNSKISPSVIVLLSWITNDDSTQLICVRGL